MSRSLTFILNGRVVNTELPSGTMTLDYLRREKRLTGTKEVCREGDCGACAVLLGQPPWDVGAPVGRGSGAALQYRVVNSCLLPLGELEGRHLVTIEGLNPREGLNPPPETGPTGGTLPPLNLVQTCFLEEGASQCGFCTPGLVVSLTGYLLRTPTPTLEGALEAVAGNICRCTGYASIRRAVARVLETAGGGGTDRERLVRLSDLGVVPLYFREIPAALQDLAGSRARIREAEGGAGQAGGPRAAPEAATTVGAPETAEAPFAMAGARQAQDGPVVVAGGTDLFVQRPGELEARRLQFLSRRAELSGMWRENGRLLIGAATTMEELHGLPGLAPTLAPVAEALQWVASSPIRQRATLGGNLVNASPIGDLTVLFLALGACLGLRSGEETRELPLQEFYRGYKKLDLGPVEVVAWIALEVPESGSFVGFEKVARRKHLDIASVNSAALLRADATGSQTAGSHAGRAGATPAGHGHPRRIAEARLSAGGVAPVPLFLARTSAHLAGKEATARLVREALEMAQQEISPIDDVRGSAAYKRLALRQLLIAHVLGAFPEELQGEDWR